MSRPFSVAIVAAIVLIAGVGWLGATLDFGTVTVVTLSLAAVAVVAILTVVAVAMFEKRDHDRQ